MSKEITVALRLEGVMIVVVEEPSSSFFFPQKPSAFGKKDFRMTYLHTNEKG